MEAKNGGILSRRSGLNGIYGVKKLCVLMAIFAAFVGPGCSRKVVVTPHSVSRDTLLDRHNRIDTLLARDSVFVGVKGDTVVREVYRWRFRSRNRADTVYKTRVDTVPVVVAAPEKTPKRNTTSKFDVAKRCLKVVVWLTRVIFILYLLNLIRRRFM